MQTWKAGLRAVFLTPILFVSAAGAATMDFEPVAVGTSFGQEFGDIPGPVVLTQDGIRMSVETFFFTDQNFQGFVRAEVVAPNAMRFPTRWLSMDNINAQFDLTQLGFNVNQVSVEFLELGGLDNFSINGGSIIELPGLASLPANVGGVALAFQELDPVTHRTRLTLTGDVDRFLIGGQELGVDTIVAIPEPTTLILLGICGACFLFRGRRLRLPRLHRAEG